MFRWEVQRLAHFEEFWEADLLEVYEGLVVGAVEETEAGELRGFFTGVACGERKVHVEWEIGSPVLNGGYEACEFGVFLPWFLGGCRCVLDIAKTDEHSSADMR